jgi:hypothetical protein
LRLFGYLKNNAKARLLFDPTPFNLETIEFHDQDWYDLYPDAEEATTPHDAPAPMNKVPVQITAFMDASHAADVVTRRSVTGYLIFIGQAPIKWYSKRQNTVESSSYGSELVAMRITVDAILELRYILRMMGIKFEDTSNILCDNQAVVINTQFPSSNLKNKHNAVAYHRCREVMAAGICRTGYIRGMFNRSDVLTKPTGPEDYNRLLFPILYGKVVPTSKSAPIRGSCTEELGDTPKSLAYLDVPIPQDYSIMRDSSIPGKGRNAKHTMNDKHDSWDDMLDTKMSPEELNIYKKTSKDFHGGKGKPK